MDVFTLARACARRWYVVLIGLLITGALAGVEYQHATATYSTGSTYYLVPPARSGNINNASFNPLGSQASALAVYIQALGSSDSLSQVAAAAPSATVKATVVGKASVLGLNATAPTAADAHAALNAYSQVADKALVTLQQSVKTPTASFYSLRLLNPDTGLTVSFAHRSRNVALVAVGGVLVTIIVADAIDVLVLGAERRRRAARRNRSDRHKAAAAPPPDDLTVDDDTVEDLFSMSAEPVTVPRNSR